MDTKTSYNSPTTKPLFRGVQIVWYLLGILEGLLAFRLLLKLFAANPAAGFTKFIYVITYPFDVPFLTVFPMSRVGGNVFEWPTLLAMLVYALLGWAIAKLLVMSRTVSTPEAATKLHEQDK